MKSHKLRFSTFTLSSEAEGSSAAEQLPKE